MKASMCFIFAMLPALAGCQAVTSAQAVAIGGPIVSGGLALVLRNNPSYIPIAQRVGSDLASADFSDLTLLGINAAVNKLVAKEGGSPDLAAVIASTFDAGLAGYLEAVGESALAKDPNAQTVLHELGQAIVTGANAAAANPKPNV